jgi:hypothetical protein
MKNIVSSLPVSLHVSEIFFRSALVAPALHSERARLRIGQKIEVERTLQSKYAYQLYDYSECESVEFSSVQFSSLQHFPPISTAEAHQLLDRRYVRAL